ncbi:hypothetical protein OHA25_51230 [Nonomuraea sp. NBC_00507]|uniref:hypothetical protein n=1 Tax=Nonomuraea sp. NBC_00507 TaxID=2976002 RepID=UPI002E16E40D
MLDGYGNKEGMLRQRVTKEADRRRRLPEHEAAAVARLRHKRDNIFAKGLGPAFIIHNCFPNNGWQAELRYTWTY